MRSRVGISLLGVAAVALLVALIGVGSLPAHSCDPLERTEHGQTLMVAALGVASIVWLLAMSVSTQGTLARRTRVWLLSFGLIELASGTAIVTYYNYQTAAYGLCG
jgi:hypothetical protein